jgi:iron complex transport system substrate-binding protein
MPLRRRLFFLPFLLLAGCQPTSAPSASSGPPNVSASAPFERDDLGREIALKGVAKRVIVIGPGAIETVYALGAEKSLVGRDSYADFPPPAKKIAVAGDYKGPSVEKCVALRPDLVIVQGETWDASRVEAWQSQIGAPVAALVATNIQQVQTDFRKMGGWLGRSKEAESLAKSLNVPRGKAKVAAFVEVGRSPLYTAGKGTLIDDVINAGGFSNVAADISGYQPFGLESLVARQPSVYIAPTTSNRAALARELRTSPALSKLKCIREGRVVAIDSNFLLRPGPRLGLGLKQLQQEARRLSR